MYANVNPNPNVIYMWAVHAQGFDLLLDCMDCRLGHDVTPTNGDEQLFFALQERRWFAAVYVGRSGGDGTS